VGIADLGGSISVDDNAGSLTVDNTVLSVTGGGTEATAQRVTIANDSTGVLSVDDNGGSLTVDGTVSVSGTVTVDTELPAAAALADNTANPTVPGVGAFAMGFDGTNWDRIRADGGAVFIQDGGNVISVDDAAGSLTVDLNGGTDALIGRVKITDGTDIATVRDLTNSDPLDVAIVDGNGDQITSFGGGTQYTEDAASAANPVGTQPVLRRRDTPVGEVSADGDVVAQNATNYGAAYVQVVNSGGSFVDTFGGGTQYTEGDTDATITGTAILWEDTSDTLRAVSAAKPLPVSDAGGSLTVDGTVSVSGTVTVDTELPAAALLGDNTANPTITSVGAFPHVWDSAGTNWDRMPGDDLGVMVRPQGAQVNDSITALNDTAGLSFGTDAGDPSFSAVGFRVAGTWTATLTFQGSMDGFDFVTIPALPVGGGPAVTTTTANGQWWVNAGGFRVIRLQATAFTSGTANVELFGSSSGQQFVSVLGDDGTTSRILKTDASGELQVDVLSMPTVSTSSQKTEDTGHTTGDTGVFILGVRNDDASSTLTNANADYSPIAVDGRGRVFTGDNQIEDLPHSTGHAGSFILGVRNDSAATAFTNADGDYSPISVDGNGRVIVTEGGGSLTIDGTVTANQGTAGTAWEVVGDVANDVGVPANPLVSGGRASTAVPTAVSADGDAVYEWLSRQGAPVVTQVPHVGLIGSQPWDLVHEGAQYTSQQTSTVLVAGGASEKIVVTQVQIQAFGTTAFDLQVYFGTGAFVRGTNRTIFDGTFKPSTTLAPGYTSLGPFIAGTNGDDIMVTTSAAGSVTISVWYYIVT